MCVCVSNRSRKGTQNDAKRVFTAALVRNTIILFHTVNQIKSKIVQTPFLEFQHTSGNMCRVLGRPFPRVEG